MIVGESQILGQLKDAFEIALTHKATGVDPEQGREKSHLRRQACVRTETKIAEMAVSVSYAAVELAKKIFSNLSEKTVLLVGAGEMAKLAARHLMAHGVHQVRITTRSPHAAMDLAGRFNATPIPFEGVPGRHGHGGHRARLDGGVALFDQRRRRATGRSPADEPAYVSDRHIRPAEHRSGGPTHRQRLSVRHRRPQNEGSNRTGKNDCRKRKKPSGWWRRKSSSCDNGSSLWKSPRRSSPSSRPNRGDQARGAGEDVGPVGTSFEPGAGVGGKFGIGHREQTHSRGHGDPQGRSQFVWRGRVRRGGQTVL
ncbi:MAG: hypothetical protein KatS3mg082_0367 [Nitrospiraceae bacterium]|nr:MAG: hypothetical protein KatS3mg082_0367 [Nitrospiraceae bacterium]